MAGQGAKVRKKTERNIFLLYEHLGRPVAEEIDTVLNKYTV